MTNDKMSALHDALKDLMEVDFVTHFVIVAAGATAEDEGTYLIKSPGLPNWQAHGMLSYEAAAMAPQPIWSYDHDCEE